MLHYKLRHAPSQIARGCTDLPHVGNHPGTSFVVCIMLITGLAGAQSGGMQGFSLSIIGAALIFGSFYFFGAWSRAELSDRISRRNEVQALLQAWIVSLGKTPDRSVRFFFEVSGDKGAQHIHIRQDGPPDVPQLPQWIVSAIDDILTERRDGQVTRLPEASEMQSITFQNTGLSAHQQLAAHNLLAKQAHKPHARGIHPRVKALQQ